MTDPLRLTQHWSKLFPEQVVKGAVDGVYVEAA
jgi:hypothetical protein